MTARSGAAGWGKQQREKLAGEIATVYVRIKWVTITAVRPPETALTLRVEALCNLRPLQRVLTGVVMTERLKNIATGVFAYRVRR